jgi:hypothetical protein
MLKARAFKARSVLRGAKRRADERSSKGVACWQGAKRRADIQSFSCPAWGGPKKERSKIWNRYPVRATASP